MKNVSLKLTKEASSSYKIGVDEIVGLKKELQKVFTPIKEVLEEKVYWTNLEFDEFEYKSRDGFIAHSHNYGGVVLNLHVPKCEEYSFGFMEFGECSGCSDSDDCLSNDEKYPEHYGTCAYESNGHLDSFLKVILKFEGVDANNKLNFYINVSGGNNDAPYFRDSPTLYEGEFKCNSIADIKKSASKHIKNILKLIK